LIGFIITLLRYPPSFLRRSLQSQLIFVKDQRLSRRDKIEMVKSVVTDQNLDGLLRIAKLC
jgi:hypothetical protein